MAVLTSCTAESSSRFQLILIAIFLAVLKILLVYKDRIIHLASEKLISCHYSLYIFINPLLDVQEEDCECSILQETILKIIDSTLSIRKSSCCLRRPSKTEIISLNLLISDCAYRQHIRDILNCDKSPSLEKNTSCEAISDSEDSIQENTKSLSSQDTQIIIYSYLRPSENNIQNLEPEEIHLRGLQENKHLRNCERYQSNECD